MSTVKVLHMAEFRVIVTGHYKQPVDAEQAAHIVDNVRTFMHEMTSLVTRCWVLGVRLPGERGHQERGSRTSQGSRHERLLRRRSECPDG